MKKLILMIALVAVCGFAQAGELSPAQKSDAVQKSAIQKGDAVQKSEADDSLGFFGRIRSRRIARIEARQAGWAAWTSARYTGSCG